MQQLNDRVFTETKVRGCNPSFVVTSAGPVVIDAPQLPTRAVEMRRSVETFGEVQYLINTEHHVDHIFGNYYFRGAGTVVNHKGLYDNFMTVYPELDPFEYAREALPTDDPDGIGLFPDRDEYYADPNKGRSSSPATCRSVSGTTTSTCCTPLGTPPASSPCTCRRSGWSSPVTASSASARRG